MSVANPIKIVVKGQILQHKGDEKSHVYLVKKGCLRSYTIDEKGKEHIFMFAPEGWIISDMVAQIYHTSTNFFIDALEPTEVEILNRPNENFGDEKQIIEIGLDKLMKRIAVLQKRVIMLMSATALERYQDFIETYPNIVQRVPQKMIASYLGVTPEALSKLRGEISKNKS